jgi:hypothetical protein
LRGRTGEAKQVTVTMPYLEEYIASTCLVALLLIFLSSDLLFSFVCWLQGVFSLTLWHSLNSPFPHFLMCDLSAFVSEDDILRLFSTCILML